MRITHHLLADADTSTALTQLVNFLIAQGWQPFGSPYQSRVGPETYKECQAMVRVEAEYSLNFPGGIQLKEATT